MPFRFERLAIPDVILITPRIFEDDRGYFLETFKQSDFEKFGIRERFVQDNMSHSARGVLRGLHYQMPPRAQGKIVQAIQGEIFDVAVDIRKKASTYGQWVSKPLSDCNRCMLYIPPGFAHGFCVLSETATIQYKCTDEYSPENERGILWNDPDLGINWPIEEPLLSAKDSMLPGLKSADLF